MQRRAGRERSRCEQTGSGRRGTPPTWKYAQRGASASGGGENPPARLTLPPAPTHGLQLSIFSSCSEDLFSRLFSYLSLVFYLPTWQRDYTFILFSFHLTSPLVIVALPGIPYGWFAVEHSAHHCFCDLHCLAAVLALTSLDYPSLEWALHS